MPSFIYTILFLSSGLWFWLAFFMKNNLPQDGFKTIIFFLVLLFLALTLTLSLPLYLHFQRKAPNFSNLKFIYKKSLKTASFFSLGITFILGLKAFDLASLINLALFLILYILLYFQIRSKR